MSILTSGLVIGSLYALMAIGLSMVYGTLRMYNFTHGSLMMLGAYFTWTLYQHFNLAISVLLAITLMIILGMLSEKILIHPFLERENPTLIAVITTLAGMIFLDNLSHIIWGPRMKQLPVFLKGNFIVSAQEILIIILAPTLLILLSMFLKSTKIGRAIRAVEQNRESALLVGIDVAKTYMITFGIAAGMAGVAGIFLGSIRFMTPTMGGNFLLKALIVVILGGLGNMNGTLIAAYLVGIIEASSMYYLGLYWTPVVIFLLMIIMLIYRPQGILGE